MGLQRVKFQNTCSYSCEAEWVHYPLQRPVICHKLCQQRRQQWRGNLLINTCQCVHQSQCHGGFLFNVNQINHSYCACKSIYIFQLRWPLSRLKLGKHKWVGARMWTGTSVTSPWHQQPAFIIFILLLFITFRTQRPQRGATSYTPTCLIHHHHTFNQQWRSCLPRHGCQEMSGRPDHHILEPWQGATSIYVYRPIFAILCRLFAAEAPVSISSNTQAKQRSLQTIHWRRSLSQSFEGHVNNNNSAIVDSW